MRSEIGLEMKLGTTSLEYFIDGKQFAVQVKPDTEFCTGNDVCLSDVYGDITKNQTWYDAGFHIVDTGPFFDFERTKAGIADWICELLKSLMVGVDTETFRLEDYQICRRRDPPASNCESP